MTRTIRILHPFAERTDHAEFRAIAPRLDGLGGKTLGFVYNTRIAIGIIHDELRRLLAPQDIGTIVKHKKASRPLDAGHSAPSTTSCRRRR